VQQCDKSHIHLLAQNAFENPLPGIKIKEHLTQENVGRHIRYYGKKPAKAAINPIHEMQNKKSSGKKTSTPKSLTRVPSAAEAQYISMKQGLKEIETTAEGTLS